MVYSSSSQLPTFRQGTYTDDQWNAHVEAIFNAIEEDELDQDNITDDEYTATYQFAKYGY